MISKHIKIAFTSKLRYFMDDLVPIIGKPKKPKSSKVKSQQTIIYEHQKEVSQNIPSKFTPRVPG